MHITPEKDDATDFVVTVERAVSGLIRRDAPSSLVLIKIDNWFESNWLHFSGKVMGAFGVAKTTLTVPPFVPNGWFSKGDFLLLTTKWMVGNFSTWTYRLQSP
jgi:hypothetical protein